MYMKPINPIPLSSSLPFTPNSHQYLHIWCTYFTVLLSLSIPKSMFTGVSPCIPAANMLYFGQFNPVTLPYPHYLIAFSTYCYVLHLCIVFFCLWLIDLIPLIFSPWYFYFQLVLFYKLDFRVFISLIKLSFPRFQFYFLQDFYIYWIYLSYLALSLFHSAIFF
jgi:hypothetical protein